MDNIAKLPVDNVDIFVYNLLFRIIPVENYTHFFKIRWFFCHYPQYSTKIDFILSTFIHNILLKFFGAKKFSRKYKKMFENIVDIRYNKIIIMNCVS